MPARSRMSLIMGQIEAENPELFAHEFRKIAKSDFVYALASTNINALASTNINQSAPNVVKNVCDYKISDEFDNGSNRTRTVSYLPLS